MAKSNSKSTSFFDEKKKVKKRSAPKKVKIEKKPKRSVSI